MQKNKKAYSVIIAMLLIGFLLVLTVTVLNLVLKELNDNKAMGNSLKAFAAAETGKELALLKIKDNWYGIDGKVELWTSLSKDILNDTASFNPNTDAMIWYDIWLKPDFQTGKYQYSEQIAWQWYSIIPLFYEDQWVFQNTENITLVSNNNVVWNLISGNSGLAGLWNIVATTSWEGKKLSGTTLVKENQTVESFLITNNNVYLILHNTSNSSVTYTLSSSDVFSKPTTQIISHGQVGRYKHNISTKYDNTEFLNMLKYAIFSE